MKRYEKNWQKQTQSGFSVVELVIILVVLGSLGLVTYAFMSASKTSQRSSAQGSARAAEISVKPTADVIWTYDSQKNKYATTSGKAPACPNPLKFDNSPVDTTTLTGVLLPGQYRGFNYKPHGGFVFANSPDGVMDIKLPMTATITGITRYIEGDQNEVQYIVTFETDCGIAFKFDHLYTLSPGFQKIAETRPAAIKDNTASDPNKPPKRVQYPAGTLIATAIGHPSTHNFSFDFGVYDYRSPNEISKNPAWKPLHTQFAASDWYGRCWLDMLPEPDASKVKAQSLIPINSNKPILVSDYCTNIPHTTLEFNSGLPVEGS